MSWEKIAGIGIFLLNVIIFFILLFTQKYPPFLVILNLISIIAIWIWLLNPKKLPSFFKEKKVDFYIAIILFTLSLIVLIYKIDTIRPGMWGDELAEGLDAISVLKTGQMPPFVASGSNPLFHGYLVAWTTAVFGHNLFAVRLPAILEGVLSVIALYVLLRQFFKRKISLIASLIFVFSYQHLIIWRQSYATGESVLFQIIGLIFLYSLFKKKDLRILIGFGLAIGAGMYSYLSFRTIGVFMLILSLLSLRRFSLKKTLQYVVILLISLFISTAVLSAYTASHWGEFWQRASSISVFGRNLPVKDVVGEILGSVKNDLGLFILSGDPNPRYNPSGFPLYDSLSSVLIVSGLILLFLKKKKLFYILLFLSIPVIANDIFSIEIFPEFHYYGTGHPNSLRISGFIPLFYLLIGFALVNLESLVKKINQQFSNIALIFICICAIVVNFYSYFGQESINPNFYLYNYRYGNVYVLDIDYYLNQKAISGAYVSSVFNSGFSKFFLNKPIVLKSIDEKNVQQTFDLITASKVVIISPFDNVDFANKLMEKVQKQPIPYVQLNTPIGPYGPIIFNSN